jgi:hypothetical protein
MKKIKIKKEIKKKFSLEKMDVAKLKNLHLIIGGQAKDGDLTITDVSGAGGNDRNG